jgi:bifunctional non-homologous end joining protein LigD
MPAKRTAPARKLAAYRGKRDFKKSPEPTGAKTKSSRKGKRLMFCVQKHLASHLHYDFRLEHEGVLLSWAVPKGPSLNPVDKRLAMKVEDHPLDYGDFEGVIPEGYGAGIVMLWDIGYWKPEVENIDQAIAKGDLKFHLEGTKLKGSWVLVRTRSWRAGAGDDGRSWLLIKHRDEWAGDVNITEFAPLSVKSSRDLPDILAADHPDIWKSNRPAAGGEAGELLQKVIEQAAAKKAKAERAGGGEAKTGRSKKTQPTKSARARPAKRPTKS